MNNLTTFNFLSNNIRAIEIDGQPWFVAADVGEVLTISNPRREIIKNLHPDEKRSMKLQNTRGRGNVIISESGLFKLVMRSDKPEALGFQDWVTREVLPAIRKDGMYVADYFKKAHRTVLRDIAALQSRIGPQAMFTEITLEGRTGFGIRHYRAFDMPAMASRCWSWSA